MAAMVTESTLLEAMLGPVVIRNDGSETKSCELGAKNKHILFYFSASWCAPCVEFTPTLIKWYEANKAKLQIEIVLVPWDKEDKEWKLYFGKMPWYSIPLTAEGAAAVDAINSHFNVTGLPTLLVLDSDGELITKSGRPNVDAHPDGAEFPWRPLSMQEVFNPDVSLVAPDGAPVPAPSVLEKGHVLMYFGKKDCVHCTRFAPTLAKFYRNNKDKDLSVVFVSGDATEAEYDAARAKLPFAALPFGAKKLKNSLIEKFEVDGFPTLVVATNKGEVLHADALHRVKNEPDRFPWAPRPVENLSSVSEALDSKFVALMLTDRCTDGDVEDKVLDAFKAVATPYFNGESKSEVADSLVFAHADENDDVVDSVRKALGFLDDEEDDEAVRFVVTLLPNGIVFEYDQAGVPTVDGMNKFLEGILAGTGKPRFLEADDSEEA